LLDSNRVLYREGKITATRGTIFDKSGKKVAWCHRSYDLYLKSSKPGSEEEIRGLLQGVKDVFPETNLTPDFLYQGKVRIKRGVTPGELKKLQRLLSSYPELIIVPMLTRVTIDAPVAKRIIGTAIFSNGRWSGLSGLEKEYDSYLNGQDGLYSVKIDKNGRWIEDSTVIKKKMLPGKNLYLTKSIEEIVNSDL